MFLDKTLVLTACRDRQWLIRNRLLCAKKLKETVYTTYSHTCTEYDGRCDLCEIIKRVIEELEQFTISFI